VRPEVVAVIRAMAKVDPGEVTDDTKLVEELGYDSLRMIELMVALETRLGLKAIDLELAVTVSTVGDVARLAEDQVRGAAA